MISALETKQNKVLEAMADAHQAGISAILGSTSPFVAQIAGAAVPTHSKDVLLERAQVAALKLQGILKEGGKDLRVMQYSSWWAITWWGWCTYFVSMCFHALGPNWGRKNGILQWQKRDWVGLPCQNVSRRQWLYSTYQKWTHCYGHPIFSWLTCSGESWDWGCCNLLWWFS
jgi:hypothetical protein